MPLCNPYLVEPVEPWVDLGERPGVVEDLRRPVVGEVHQGLPGRRRRVQVDGSAEPAPDTEVQKGESFIQLTFTFEFSCPCFPVVNEDGVSHRDIIDLQSENYNRHIRLVIRSSVHPMSSRLMIDLERNFE